jgi:hypothetical protein
MTQPVQEEQFISITFDTIQKIIKLVTEILNAFTHWVNVNLKHGKVINNIGIVIRTTENPTDKPMPLPLFIPKPMQPALPPAINQVNIAVQQVVHQSLPAIEPDMRLASIG